MIYIKRIYDKSSDEDGFRILVDRLWPRGIKKENLNIDKWLKDIAPSTKLRKWFNHEPEKWQNFKTYYEAELDENPALTDIKNLIITNKIVTLLYAAHDEKYNHAVVLQEYLKRRIEQSK